MPQITAGVGGVNREIKQGYAGVSGVNRPIFSGKVSAVLTVSGSRCGIRKGCLYTTVNGTSASSIYSSTFSIKFSKKLTFNNAGPSGRDVYLHKKQGSWYYCPYRITIGTYQATAVKSSSSTSYTPKIPSGSIPMVTDSASFYISNSSVSSNTTSDTEIQLDQLIFYPEEYPNGLEIPMDLLVTAYPSNNPSQTIELIEL